MQNELQLSSLSQPWFIPDCQANRSEVINNFNFWYQSAASQILTICIYICHLTILVTTGLIAFSSLTGKANLWKFNLADERGTYCKHPSGSAFNSNVSFFRDNNIDVLNILDQQWTWSKQISLSFSFLNCNYNFLLCSKRTRKKQTILQSQCNYHGITPVALSLLLVQTAKISTINSVKMQHRNCMQISTGYFIAYVLISVVKIKVFLHFNF